MSRCTPRLRSPNTRHTGLLGRPPQTQSDSRPHTFPEGISVGLSRPRSHGRVPLSAGSAWSWLRRSHSRPRNPCPTQGCGGARAGLAVAHGRCTNSARRSRVPGRVSPKFGQRRHFGLTRLDLILLPRSIHRDPDFVRKARISGYVGVATFLTDAAENSGVRFRWYSGVTAMPPFATRPPVDRDLYRGLVGVCRPPAHQGNGGLGLPGIPPSCPPPIARRDQRGTDRGVLIAEHDGVRLSVSISVRPVKDPVASDNRL